MTHLIRWWCALWGHHDQLVFARTRICLRCASCGRETPGWDVELR